MRLAEPFNFSVSPQFRFQSAIPAFLYRVGLTFCPSRGQIVLTPVRIQRGDAVRAKLADLDLKALLKITRSCFDRLSANG
jgi:hypothetical protein